jgi:AraC family transcriptional regulator, alkane utilization regulator
MTQIPETLLETPRLGQTNADAFDVLSDLLRVVRLTGAVLFRGELTAPWAFETMDSAHLAAMLLPGARRLVLFHVVAQGRCWIALPEGNPAPLATGDIVMLPYGDVHTMASERGQKPVSVAGLVKSTHWNAGLPIVAHGGGGERTRLICGFVHCDELLFNPLLKALPPLLHVRDPQMSDRSLLAATARNLIDEVDAAHAGSACVLQRLTELLFIETLRGHMATLHPEAIGWLGALNEPMVGRALQALHADPAHPWTVEALVRRLGTSRSVLATRFKRLLGESPMHYLTCWRLQLAAQRLRDGSETIAAIAAQVGYESEAAFNRAFKRQAGEPPAAWRARAQRLARTQGAPREAQR